MHEAHRTGEPCIELFSDPKLRRAAHEHSEKFKKTFDYRHDLFTSSCPSSHRLKSRHRFLKDPLDEPPANYPLSEDPPSGVLSD